MTAELDHHVQINGNEITIQHLQGESKAERSKHLAQKLVARDNLRVLGDVLRMTNRRIAYASGAYDVIHKGHARFLNLAKSLGDVLVVGLNSDASIKAYKGEDRPILNQNDRAEMLSFLESVDYLTIYDELTGGEVIRQLRPHAYLCVEGSWAGDIATKDEVIAMAEVNGESYYTPRQDPYQSTSNIIERIASIYGPKLLEDYKRLMEANGNGK